MADYASEITKNDRFKGKTERGLLALKSWESQWDAVPSAVYHIVDSVNIGAGSIHYQVVNRTSLGTGFGAEALTAKLYGSSDGDNWVELAYQDEAGTDKATGGNTIAANAIGHIFLVYANDPIGAAYRMYRLELLAAGTNKCQVFSCLK